MAPERDETRSGIHIVLLTGLSGAGKSTAAKCFEDAGYYCLDNLPLPLLERFLGEHHLLAPGRTKIAAVTDVRAPGFADDFPRVLEEIRARESTDLIFFEAPEEVLLRRFSETRRPHPLAGEQGRVIDAIRSEREILAGLRAAADLVVDTAEWSVHDLRNHIYRAFLRESGEEPELSVTVTSFGFKHGIPSGADLVLDVRFLPNPHFVPELRPLSGLDEPVRQYLEGEPEFTQTVERLLDLLLYLLPRYRRENRSYLTVAIGCTGGHHRSVAITEALRQGLSATGWRVRSAHRDIERPE